MKAGPPIFVRCPPRRGPVPIIRQVNTEFSINGAAGPGQNAPCKVIVVLNRHAGGDTEDGFEAKLEKMFRTHGLDPLILHTGNGAILKKQLAAEDPAQDAIVAAGGGDGTVSAVAAELAGTDRTLGVLPLGTLNHFAKDLGIPLDLETAVQTLAHGRVSAVDVGEVNGRVFINNSGLGIYPQIVSQREADQKWNGRGKWPAFARAALDVFRRHPFLHLHIRLNGEERFFKTASVFVGNNEYEVAGLNLGKRACLNSGRLGFYLANRTGRLGLLCLAMRALAGQLHRAEDFEAFCINEARVDSSKRTLLVSTDGEVTPMTPPLHFRMRPGALRVLVPAEKEPA